jgi:hypothetical protein
VNDRKAGRAPGGKKIGNSPFGVGVVTRSPFWIVEALLYVDQKQGAAA